MNKAQESDERMIRMVNEMLSINHAEDTLETRHTEDTVDVVKLIDEILFDFTGESFKRGIEIFFLRPEHPLLTISADPEKIRVVIQNLIENGIKYSNKGGKVFISLEDTSAELRVSVRDTGIGIGPEDQPHIFTKNFRTLSAKKKDSVGSGLGLYTTKRMVEKHAGKIWFESVIDSGTTFHVSFPRKSSA